jgi:cytochrome c-type biogenesis protein CcmH
MKFRPMILLCGLLGVILALPALAVIETYEFDSPALEQRYRTLTAELRCPKCQNQNIADSNAPIAQDLRKQLYLQLQSGATDGEILDFMVARYGEFVLYRPRFSSATAALWLAPLLLLLLAVAVVLLVLGRKRGRDADAGLDAQEQLRLRELLEEAERRR